MKKLFFYSFLCLTLFFMLFFKNRGIKDYIFMHKKLDELVKKNKELEKENQNLKVIVKKLKNDYKYIEKIAREKYNMIRNDEIMILIIKHKGGEK